LLARLAVNRREQETGLGKALLVNALSRAASAANEIGALAILVHAIDDEAVRSYTMFGFGRSPIR
jgi:hypothetical protein